MHNHKIKQIFIFLRLDDLKKNLESWGGYEDQRNKLDGQINEAEVEFKNTVRIYNLDEGPKNHTERLATASRMRKQIEETYQKMSGANDELAKMLEDDMKNELQDEVCKHTYVSTFFLDTRGKSLLESWDTTFIPD